MLRSLFRASCALIAMCVGPAASAQWLLVSSLGSDQILRYRDGAYAGVLIDMPPGLDEPHGLLDLGSRVLICSYATNSVLSHNSFNCELTTFLGPGSGLVNPAYIMRRTGGVLISSQGSDEVLAFAYDGTPLGPLVTAGLGGLDGPSGLAIVGNVLYVAGRYSGNVLSYDATTGAFLGVIADTADGLGAGTTFGLQVASNGDLYVASNGAVRRIDLDTNTVIAVIPATLPIGIERIDFSGDILYVATDNNLRRIDLATDTLGPPLLTGGAVSTLNFFTVDSIAEPPCPQDLSGDGAVSAADLAFLLGAWGPNSGAIADFNADGIVNAADLATLLGAWGACPSATCEG